MRYDLGLIHWKGQNKARLQICFIEHKKLDTAVDLFHWKCWNTLQLRIYSIQNAEILYSWGFILFKMLKYFTAEDLFHSKCWNNVWLKIYSKEKSQNKAQLGIYSIEKTEIRYGWGQPRPQRIFLL